MIEINGVNKSFGDVKALDNIEAAIQEGSIFGLVGTNGAGKSTLLRVLCGVLRPDTGAAMIDGQNVYENPAVKEKICFLSDTAYFFPNATIQTMEDYYTIVYPAFNRERFTELVEKFGLDKKRKINTFSKGMKKQVSVLLGVCTGTKYLLCDETFDGLDPVMRQAVKSIFAMELMNRDFTPVIASHSLRELEDICDHVGILDKGKMLLEKSLADMQGSTVKLQMVGEAPKGLEILHESASGRLRTYILRGTQEQVQAAMQVEDCPYFDILPLSLEEIFIYELGGADYEVKNILL